MGTNIINQILEDSYLIQYHEVELEENTFKVFIRVIAPQDNTDLTEIIKIKNKIRKNINRGYKIKFNFEFTI